jgi:hypothetical protein
LSDAAAVITILSLFILAGAALMMTTMTNRRRLRELAYRERIAMIERGLIPPPELDPGRFEAASGLSGRAEVDPGSRFRTAGVTLIGFGLGLMMLITFAAGSPEVGIGVGGAWAILGAASLLNYFLISRGTSEADLRLPPQWAPPSQPARREPPENVAP